MKIDGKKIANNILHKLKKRVRKLRAKKIIPHLVIILINKNPSSIAYVNQKKLKGKKIGAKITLCQYPNSVTTKTLLDRFNDLNHFSTVHGIIVQRPLPQHLDSKQISLAINPNKDVDGFHPNSNFQPPIALAVLRVFEEVFKRFHLDKGGTFTKWLKSKKITVIGKGETGGKPIIHVLKKMNIKPSIIDTKASNVQNLTKKADIIISAVGKPNIVKPVMIKKATIIISVGLHKGSDGKMHGDYEEEQIKNTASFYTPTPGGVGPVNVAMLLKNLVTAAENFYLSKSTEA